MLNLGGLDDLARRLDVDRSFLHGVLEDFDLKPASLFKELTLWPADQKKKPRDVICIKKPWRLLQKRIHDRLLLPWLVPSKYSHGGVKKRSTATNARAHLGNTHAFVTDISNFFPSISCSRVNSVFLAQGCTYKVAKALTRLCTHDYHLAVGLVTSPIIANEILRPVDEHIARACRDRGLAYSRYIDDIAISGRYCLRSCGIGDLVQKILARYHFAIAQNKTRHGRLDTPPNNERSNMDNERLAITGIELNGDHINPSRDYIRKLERMIADHVSLANDGPFDGPLYMQGEVYGRVYYACTLNSGRRRILLSKLKEINWWKVMDNAVDRNLMRYRNRLTPRGEARPNCSVPLPLSAGAKYAREYYEQHDYDPAIPPFDVDQESLMVAAHAACAQNG